MSGGISAGTMAMMAVGSMVAAKMMAPKAPQMPTLMEGVKPPPVPQAASTPDQQATRRNAASQSGGYGPGSATGTLLTGAGGVGTDELLLGKNKLFGQ